MQKLSTNKGTDRLQKKEKAFLNFEKTFEKCFFYEKNPRIAVGVSGGPDSLALAILLNRWNISAEFWESKFPEC
mgnify:CR=1 FL=1